MHAILHTDGQFTIATLRIVAYNHTELVQQPDSISLVAIIVVFTVGFRPFTRIFYFLLRRCQNNTPIHIKRHGVTQYYSWGACHCYIFSTSVRHFRFTLMCCLPFRTILYSQYILSPSFPVVLCSIPVFLCSRTEDFTPYGWLPTKLWEYFYNEDRRPPTRAVAQGCNTCILPKGHACLLDGRRICGTEGRHSYAQRQRCSLQIWTDTQLRTLSHQHTNEGYITITDSI
jgi:hypothetical protein